MHLLLFFTDIIFFFFLSFQFDSQYDVGSNHSFFNLQIELLIEGMVDAEYCGDYKFHEERGFRVTYFTQVRTRTSRCYYILLSFKFTISDEYSPCSISHFSHLRLSYFSM